MIILLIIRFSILAYGNLRSKNTASYFPQRKQMCCCFQNMATETSPTLFWCPLAGAECSLASLERQSQNEIDERQDEHDRNHSTQDAAFSNAQPGGSWIYFLDSDFPASGLKNSMAIVQLFVAVKASSVRTDCVFLVCEAICTHRIPIVKRRVVGWSSVVRKVVVKRCYTDHPTCGTPLHKRFHMIHMEA